MENTAISESNMILAGVMAKGREVAIPEIVAGTYNNRGVELQENGLANFYEAKNDLEKAIQLDPSFALAYWNLGILNGKLGNFKLEMENFKRAIVLDSSLLNQEKKYRYWSF